MKPVSSNFAETGFGLALPTPAVATHRMKYQCRYAAGLAAWPLLLQATVASIEAIRHTPLLVQLFSFKLRSLGLRPTHTAPLAAMQRVQRVQRQPHQCVAAPRARPAGMPRPLAFLRAGADLPAGARGAIDELRALAAALPGATA